LQYRGYGRRHYVEIGSTQNFRADLIVDTRWNVIADRCRELFCATQDPRENHTALDLRHNHRTTQNRTGRDSWFACQESGDRNRHSTSAVGEFWSWGH